MTGPWRSRGYLPHFDQPGLLQMITFRLADSLPAEALERMADDPRLRSSVDRRRQLNQWLLAGHGACHLRNPQIAITVERAFQHFDGARYALIAWVVMPNHVHVLIETFADHTLADVVNSWKTFTAREANRILGRQGQFWYREYFDRAIRDEKHFDAAVRYIHDNPVKAGLVAAPEEWPYSSALRFAGDDELDRRSR